MGNASAKDIHDAVDASDLEKLEKILEAKIELIDALSKEVPINTFQPTPITSSSYCLLLCSSPLLSIVDYLPKLGRNPHLQSLCEWEHGRRRASVGIRGGFIHNMQLLYGYEVCFMNYNSIIILFYQSCLWQFAYEM